MRSPYEPYCITIIRAWQEVFLCYSIAIVKINTILSAIGERLEEIRRTLKEYTEAINANQKAHDERQKHPQVMPVLVSFDEGANAAQNAQNSTQQTIARWTKRAVFAAIIYAGIAAWQGCEIHRATSTTQQQIRDSEDAQSAQLVIEDFKPKLTEGKPGQGLLVDGEITVTNGGATVAREIYPNVGSGWSARALPDMWKNLARLKPIPNPAGPSILPNHSVSYSIHDQLGDWEEVKAGHMYTGYTAAISYVDIFNRPHIQTDCFMYYADQRRQQFFRCPGEMHAIGDIEKDDK